LYLVGHVQLQRTQKIKIQIKITFISRSKRNLNLSGVQDQLLSQIVIKIQKDL